MKRGIKRVLGIVCSMTVMLSSLTVIPVRAEEMQTESIELSTEMVEEAETEEIEEKKELTISDDAIYEAIFGTMPERPKDDEPIEKNEPEDERAPEEIAENILNTVDAVLAKSAKSAKKDKKENQE